MSVPVVTVPTGIEWMSEAPGGPAWLQTLPSLVGRAAERWSLRVGEPYPGSHVSWAAPARRLSGDDVVLKLQFPHVESEDEAEALRRWDGNGAVRLLGHHAGDRALLLERCRPGTNLWDEPAEAALDVVVGLLGRTLVPVDGGFTTLAHAARGWMKDLPATWEASGRPFERRLIDAAVDLLGELSAEEASEPVLVNQDLHGGNVLRAERQPWLVIDPKPLIGDVAFAAAPVVRSRFGHSRREVLGRLDAVVDGLGLERDRAAGWTVAHAIAWSFDEGTVIDRHVDTARWLLDR